MVIQLEKIMVLISSFQHNRFMFSPYEMCMADKTFSKSARKLCIHLHHALVNMINSLSIDLFTIVFCHRDIV